MTAALRRDACPSLTAPMLTGDGWLARLTFTDGLSGEGLAGLAAVAARLGNGLIEVTSRGSLQLRARRSRPKLSKQELIQRMREHLATMPRTESVIEEVRASARY